jgi:hypothetical protein
LARAASEQSACQPSGSRPDFDYRAVVKRSSNSGYALRQVQVEQKVLAETLVGDDAVPRDDFPQRRQT